MIQPKIQEVFTPTKDITRYIYELKSSSGIIQSRIFLRKQALITFTPEEFERFKREFGAGLLNKVIGNIEYEDIPYTNCMECGNSETIISKNSILEVLEPFLKENTI